jgi:hypothetical protein
MLFVLVQEAVFFRTVSPLRIATNIYNYRATKCTNLVRRKCAVYLLDNIIKARAHTKTKTHARMYSNFS